MRFSDVVIPLRAAWSSPFVRWQGPAADLRASTSPLQVTATRSSDGASSGRSRSSCSGSRFRRRSAFYGAPTLAAPAGLSGHQRADARAGLRDLGGVRCTGPRRTRAENGGGARLVVATDRTSNGPHLVYPSTAAPGGTPDSENWVLDNFGRDPVTGEAMLATAEQVGGGGRIEKAELDELRGPPLRAVPRRAGRRPRVPARVDGADRRRQPRRKPVEIEEDWGVRPIVREELEALAPVRRAAWSATAPRPTRPTARRHGRDEPQVARDRADDGPVAADPRDRVRARRAGRRCRRRPFRPPARRSRRPGSASSDVRVIKTHNPFAVNDVWFARELGVDAERAEPVRLQPRLRPPAGADRRPRRSSS